MRWPWVRKRWQTPAGFWTPFGSFGDPSLDRPGRREELYARVFGTADGRTVLADILAMAGIGGPDREPGVDADTGMFRSGAKANALSIARLAGLDTGELGRALVAGKLEAMTNAKHDDDDAVEAVAAAYG